MKEYVFDGIKTDEQRKWSSFDKRQTLKWLNDVLENYQKPLEEIEQIQVIRHCVKNDLAVPIPIVSYFGELIRDELANWAGNINHATVPLYAINAIDEAHFFAKIYYTYAAQRLER